MGNDKITISVRTEDRARYNRIAKAYGISVSELIRRSVDYVGEHLPELTIRAEVKPEESETKKIHTPR